MSDLDAQLAQQLARTEGLKHEALLAEKRKRLIKNDQAESDLHPREIADVPLNQQIAVQRWEERYGDSLVRTVAGWDGYFGPDMAVQFVYSHGDDDLGIDVKVFDEEGNVLHSLEFP